VSLEYSAPGAALGDGQMELGKASAPEGGGHGTTPQGSGHGPELPEIREHLNNALRQRVRILGGKGSCVEPGAGLDGSLPIWDML